RSPDRPPYPGMVCGFGKLERLPEGVELEPGLSDAADEPGRPLPALDRGFVALESHSARRHPRGYPCDCTGLDRTGSTGRSRPLCHGVSVPWFCPGSQSAPAAVRLSPGTSRFLGPGVYGRRTPTRTLRDVGPGYLGRVLARAVADDRPLESGL